MKPSLKFIAISDSIDSFDPQAETTSFILHEAFRRKFPIWQVGLDGIFLKNGEVFFRANKIEIVKVKKIFEYKVISEEIISALEFDVFLLRKDPPVDIHFIDHLSLLEIVEKDQSKKRLFINSPSGVKLSNEKIFPFHFKKLSPPTLISNQTSEMMEFIKFYGKSVIKPLNSSGGRGIYILSLKDPNHKQIMLESTQQSSQYVMIQKFLPQVKKGDKRILLFQGEILGAFIRVPQEGDFKGNMHQGAQWKKTIITKSEFGMIDQISPILLELGLNFVGVDFIGSYITEINTTSPMGIREINQLYSLNCERILVDKILAFFLG